MRAASEPSKLSNWQAAMKISAPASVETSGVRRPSKLRAAVHMTPCAVIHSTLAIVSSEEMSGVRPPLAAAPSRRCP